MSLNHVTRILIWWWECRSIEVRSRNSLGTFEEHGQRVWQKYIKIDYLITPHAVWPNPGKKKNKRGNSSLWKRVIAWERSHAASGYGIIWGDADRNKQGGNLVRNVIVDWFFNRTTDSNKIGVIVLDDQKSRKLRRIRTTGLAVYLDDCTIL